MKSQLNPVFTRHQKGRITNMEIELRRKSLQRQAENMRLGQITAVADAKGIDLIKPTRENLMELGLIRRNEVVHAKGCICVSCDNKRVTR